MSPSGGWINAPPLPGHIIINTGDIMEAWSSFIFPSTKHRVLMPNNNEASKRSRFSMAYFCHPAHEVVISPIPSQVRERLQDPVIVEKNSASIFNITAHQHLLNKLSKSYN